MPVTEQERTALALSALGEITDPADVGDLLAIEEVEPGVVDVRFACRTAAYADWHWTVSTSDLQGVEPTVLEVELLPGDESLLAPPWVPWTERLAEWRKQHPDERHPDEPEVDELGVDEDDEPEDDAGLDEDDALDDADEDDLAVDDELDELDETELEGVESPEESEQDSDDISDEDEESDEDDRPARPGEVDRSL